MIMNRSTLIGAVNSSTFSTQTVAGMWEAAGGRMGGDGTREHISYLGTFTFNI